MVVGKSAVVAVAAAGVGRDKVVDGSKQPLVRTVLASDNKLVAN